MKRRTFIKWSGTLFALPALQACDLLSGNANFPITFTGPNASTAHKIRTQEFPDPQITKELDTIIVGGGISGLSAARWLKNAGHTNFNVFELESAVGGNARGGKNKISEYPFAAHYVPIPNNTFTELLHFFEQHQIITGYNEQQLPVYNPYYICSEPQERLFFRGIWHDGLPPKNGLNTNEWHELQRFLNQMEQFKLAHGVDGKPAFTIPLEWSSTDPAYTRFDQMTMQEWLEKESYTQPFTHWFIDYCCKDDFGTPASKTSAWAGLHYFASRNGKAANCSTFDILAWPEGNHFLTKCLMADVAAHIQTQHLTYKIEKEQAHWKVFVWNEATQQTILYLAKTVIMACPQMVNKHLLKALMPIDYNYFQYYPWLVANITINKKSELNGSQDLAWDNVSYNSPSLGYVNATHLSLASNQQETVITYYYNFSINSAKEERLTIASKTPEQWKQFILDDLKLIHPTIANNISAIEVNVLGHGMISPTPGFLSHPARAQLTKGLPGLYFAHSDCSGISIFEQAFYRGIEAAKQVLHYGS